MQTELRTNIMNWQDPNALVSPHFTVSDCLTLHAWNRLATSADGADFQKLIVLCNKLEEIRNILDCPMYITSMYRSPEYNKSQGINPVDDVHSMCLAADFKCDGHYTIDEVKELLEPELEKLDIRMEFDTTSWIHIDLRAPGPSGRYFKV